MPRNVFVALTLFAASACNESEPSLDGREFRLQTAEGYDVLSGTSIYTRFHDGQLSAGAGCNSMGGGYAVRDGVLIVTELARTERGCQPAAHAQDEWLSDFLIARPTLALEDNLLVLSAKGATLTFLDREVADPDRPLVGTRWSIDTFMENAAASKVHLMAPPSAEFRADDTFSIDTTCNTITGRFSHQNDELSLSNVSTTDAACPGAATSAEAHLQRLFARPTLKLAIEARRLTLGDSTLGISATAAD